MYDVIVFGDQKEYVDDFLALPQRLYDGREIMQNVEEERKILEETHVLNKYFRQYKILAYRRVEACGRCVVTIYPDAAYLGYFECVEPRVS